MTSARRAATYTRQNRGRPMTGRQRRRFNRKLRKDQDALILLAVQTVTR